MAASKARIRIHSPAIGEKHTKRCPLANKEKISSSYLAHIPRLTLLVPDIVEAILDGRQPKGLVLADFMEPFPAEWDEQRRRFGFEASVSATSSLQTT